MKEEIFAELKENLEKSVQALEKSFTKVRTGRASLALLDGIKVDYYGVPTPLNQVAGLSIPEAGSFSSRPGMPVPLGRSRRRFKNRNWDSCPPMMAK